jgi:hypothetical protein
MTDVFDLELKDVKLMVNTDLFDTSRRKTGEGMIKPVATV